MKNMAVACIAFAILFGANAGEDYAAGASAAFDLNGRGAFELPPGALVHNGGTLAGDETWAAGQTHVVYGTVVVPSNAVLRVASGTTVKFVAGGILSDGLCIANGATFTDIDDGAGMAMPSYVLRGNFETDAATQVRFAKYGDEFETGNESAAFDLNGRGAFELPPGAFVHNGGTLAGDETWAAGQTHVVYGTVVVPSNVVLRVASGATVKFVAGGIFSEGLCIANGATFTDIDDGAGMAMPSYVLRGNFETDAATQVRFAKYGDEFETGNESAAFDLNLRGDLDLPDDAVVHAGGVVSSDETWTADCVHVVYGTIIVAQGVTLTIEPGAVVKFVSGGIYAHGTCIANGAVFTDIGDGDGSPLPSYVLKGDIATDDETQMKFMRGGDECAADGGSGPFRLDIADDEYRFAHEDEEITYSSSWNGSNGVKVTVAKLDGTLETLVDEAGIASGCFKWSVPAAQGLYRFAHQAGSETLEAGFIVLDGAVVHDGTIASDETWTQDVVHIIGANTYVASGVVLTIEAGAVVKFMDGKVLSMSGGGICNAEGVVFTSLHDDTAGGDTLADGDATKPEENSWTILGLVNDNSATEYRYGTIALCGSIGTDVTWRREKTYVVDGTLTVASGVTLTIPPGTVVKFTEGSSLAVESGGECIAKGIVFTHIADDAVGGDTMGDGDATAPEYGKYRIDANIADDDATEYRYYVPTTLSSSISTDTVLRGNRVYVASNDVTVASGATLAIGNGATIKFAAGKSLRLRSASRLVVNGTRSRPVVLTSLKDDAHGGDTNGDGSVAYPGDWGGVIANGARIEAEYAQFLFGGGVNGNGYGARASCFMWDNASGAFAGCRFSGSPMDGCFAQNATFANCIFDDNDRGLVSHTGTIVANNCVAANNRIGFFSHTSALVVRNSISSFNTVSAITGDGGSRETANCYFGDAPGFLDPENGDYRIAADSPCVDAGDAAYAPEKDYYGSPRYAMTYDGEARPDIGIYEVLPKRVASDVDLEAVEVSVSGNSFAVGDSVTVKWKVRNIGTRAAQGPWTDAVSAVDASGAVVALGSRTMQRNLAPGATVECEGTFRIPAMAEGTARIRLVVNSEREVFEGTLTGNNTATLPAAFNVEIPAWNGDEYLIADIPAGSSAAFRLPSNSTAKSLLFMCGPDVSAFGASGRMPRRGMEDTTAVALSAQGVDFLVLPVPDGAAENGFVFVLENSGASLERVIGGEQTEDMEVYEVYPARLAVGEPATLRLRGVGMGDVSYAMLDGPKRQYGRVVQIVFPTEALVAFSLANAESGTYDLYVQSTNHTFHTYKNAVEVYKPLEGPKLEARIEGPSAIRVGRIVSARIVYSNVGDMPMRAPYFMLSSDNSKFRLEGEEDWQEGYIEVMGLGPGVDPGVLAPGETGSVAYEFISLGGAKTRLESDADTSDYWASHADAAAAAANRVNRRGRRVVRYTELERYAEEFSARPETSNAASGVLRDSASGEPLAGVEVCAMSQDGELLSYDTVDANGVFVLEGLPNATNLVLSVVEGAFADDLPAVMPATGDLLALKWYGTKGWTVNVSIEGASAEDFEQGIEVELLRIGDESATTHLTFTNAVDGVAAATVEKDGIYIVRGKTRGGCEQFSLVECAAGSTIAEAVIDFAQGHVVSGVVSAMDGSGLPGALLSLSPKGEWNGYARTVTSGADGAFSFGCIEDGEYLLSWTKNDYGSDVAMDVLVSGGDIAGLSPQCMAFEQSITGTANAECAGMTAAFATSAGGSVTATIAEDGTFVLEGLSAGRGTFSIMDGAGNIIYMMRDLYVRPGANTLDVAAETELCNVIGATIDEEGSPVQAVWVFSSTSGDGGTGYANENGKCLVKLRKATYDVSVAADGFVTRTFRRKIADSCKLTATLERGGCAQVAADAEACLVSFSADGIVDDGVEAQEGGTVSGAYTNGTEVTAFVVCLDKAYRTDSIVIETSAIGTLSRIEGGRALTVSATGDRADVAAFRFALMDGSGFVATWPVEEGKLELTEFPRIAVKVSAVAPDGSIISSVDVAADATVASVATARALPISGCIVDDMPAMLAGGAVSFGNGDGTILVTAEVTPFGTFRADYVSAAYERVWVHLPNGIVFSLSRAEAEAANFAMTPPDLDEMGLSQLQVVDENGEPVEGAEVDVETADGYETTLTTDRRGFVWIVTSVHQDSPKYNPPRLPEDPPQKQPDVKPENPASEPTPAQETKKQLDREPKFACPKCGAFPCVCKVEPPTPPEETPPEPPQDIKNICPTCGQIMPCSCNDKGKETEEKKNNDTNGQNPIEEEPVAEPELEEFEPKNIDIDLPEHWSIFGDWEEKYAKAIGELQRRWDNTHKEPNPQYGTCKARNCVRNAELWNKYKNARGDSINQIVWARNELKRVSDLAKGDSILSGKIKVIIAQLLKLTGEIASTVNGIGKIKQSGALLNRLKNFESSIDKLARIISSVRAFKNRDIEEIIGVINTELMALDEYLYDKLSEMKLTTRGDLVAINTIRGLNLLGSLFETVKLVRETMEEMDDFLAILRRMIVDASKKVAEMEYYASIPYHKCPGDDDDDNPPPPPPPPSPRNPHPPYPKPWKEPTSVDPNEVAGPLGVGASRYVKAGDEMFYTVYFENKSDASAAAQDVYIANPLSEWLDWSTFEMRDVGFNNQIDRGLVGLQSGMSEVALNNTPYFVQSAVALDESSGSVGVELHIIDKTTEYGYPEDPYAGILPPNDSTHRGEGYISYRIKVRDDVPANVVITNSATIVFDYNDPIVTDPAWWNTVGTPGAAFETTEVGVDEGATATIIVFGGSDTRPASVKVYLAYNTAAAADLDLAKGEVDGVQPKGGLKFPLTLAWEAGEIGEKAISIPVKTDKAVEDDEFFSLQLADPVGMELGESDVCTVTIADANEKTLKAAVSAYRPKKGETVATNSVTVAGMAGGFVAGSGEYASGSKLTLTSEARPGWAFSGWRAKNGDGEILSGKAKWQIAVTNDAAYEAVFEKIPYVRALAVSADAGKVSGSGYCAAGKKITLKAAANKGFTFIGWVDEAGEELAATPALVIDRTSKPSANTKTSTTITQIEGDMTYFAVFAGDPRVTATPVAFADEGGIVSTGGGKVSGAGRYAAGKKVTLRATANKGYVFCGWYSEESVLVSQQAGYSFEMGDEDVDFYARFATAEEDAASIEFELDGIGISPSASPALETNVTAGVYFDWPLAAGALSQPSIKVSGLPSGMKFAAKDVVAAKTKQVLVPANTIYGAPTAASKVAKDGTISPSKVKVTVTTAGKSKVDYEISLAVDALPVWATGSFDGAAYEGDNANPSGIVQAFTVAASGKISGKVLKGGKTWTLGAASFDSYDAEAEAYIATVVAKIGKETDTYEVAVSEDGISATSPTASWQASQNLWKRDDTKAAQPDIKKNIVVEYYPTGDSDDKNNIVKFTFKKNGTVSFAGKIGGVGVSGASQLVRDGESWKTTVYAPPKPSSKPPFDGWCETLSVDLTMDGQSIVIGAAH